MFGTKPHPKLPPIPKLKRELFRAERDYVESLFPVINATIEEYKTMLIFIVEWDLHTNSIARKECWKAMKSRVIPTFDVLIQISKDMKGTGNVIANVIWQAAKLGKEYASSLATVCQTGNFQKRKWETKRKLFAEYVRPARDFLKYLQNAFRQGTLPDVREQVSNDLMHIYINPANDTIDGWQRKVLEF